MYVFCVDQTYPHLLKTVAIGTGTKDKAYRRYALAVERALGSFDTAQQEWADYISFLNRLLKASTKCPFPFGQCSVLISS